MCLKHASEKELIQEIQRRIDRGLIDWSFSYDYTTDFTSMALISNQCGYRLNFRQKTGIENSFICRQVYQKLEPILLKAREERERETQMEKIGRNETLMEALKNEIEKKKN